jgi:aspartate/methionine/tyrosine aminotransferase
VSRHPPAAAANQGKLRSERAAAIDVSGIRRVFELGARLRNPIDLSIGQPDFPVPEPIKEAAIAAIRADRNGYTLTQGSADLRDSIAAHLSRDVGWETPSAELGLLVTSGTSGAMLLAFMALLDPGDEVVVPDPYFVIYPAMATLVGARVVYCDTYPDFRMTAGRIEPLLTDRTKLLVLNSPSNPSGVVLTPAEIRDIVELCESRGVLPVSDEIYDEFTYDDARVEGRCPSAARFTRRLLLVRGFGKTYGCTGWRMGYAAGPRAIVDEMAKLQQYTFVCAPSIAQAGCAAAFGVDMTDRIRVYQQRRDLVMRTLEPVTPVVRPGGAFYAFVGVQPKWSSGTQFADRALEGRVLLIPGRVFSRRDTHVRVSFAVADRALAAGLEVIRDLLVSGP